MKKLDIFLQKERFNQAKKYIRKGDFLLDIGCQDGELFDYLDGYISKGIGIDPALLKKTTMKNATLFPGYFPDAISSELKFNAITMLAVLEHIPAENLQKFSQDFQDHLELKGRLIITVPDIKVDYILILLKFFRLVEAKTLDEHYGYDINMTEDLFTSEKINMIKHKKFQLGLNNLFVFEKIAQ